MNSIIVAILIAAMILAIFIALLWRIDDWRRDFVTNQATTSENAVDRLLRPVDYHGSLDQLAYLVKQAVGRLPRWNLAEERHLHEEIELHFTRKTALLGFIDDIHVTIRPHAGGARMSAHSQSRRGKGDLGQNPRNLKELGAAVRKQGASKPT